MAYHRKNFCKGRVTEYLVDASTDAAADMITAALTTRPDGERVLFRILNRMKRTNGHREPAEVIVMGPDMLHLIERIQEDRPPVVEMIQS